MRPILALLCCLLLAACWQVKDPVVAQGVRVDGLADGLYRRPDGSELMVRWNTKDGRYDIGVTGGSARVAPLGEGLYLVDYADAVRLILVATLDDGDVVVRTPTADAEARLTKAHDLRLKAGPVRILTGKPESVRALASDVASLTADDFSEAERLTRIR